MHFPKKYSKIFKYTTLATLTSSAGWIYYQIKKTRDILNNAIDTSILSMHDSLDEVQSSSNNNNFLVLEFSGEPWSIKSIWNTMLFSYAKRLILLANNENKYIRKRAVRQLSKIQTLDFWHFTELSQLIDSRTAVGLARTLNADQRYFPEPPITLLGHSQVMIVDLMRELLVNLHERNEHSCLGYFISKFFVDHQDVGKFADSDTHSLALSMYIQSTHDILPLCLETLLHHASQGNNALEIVNLNGLPLLMELYNRYQNNSEIVATICRIISYISIHTHLRDELFKTGWISILAKWVHDEDVRINIPAAKALANLDPDEDPVYLQRLYLLHPQTRINTQIRADVVFVHGLLGGVFFTWRQRNQNHGVLGLAGKKPSRDLSQEDPIPGGKKLPNDIQIHDFINDVDDGEFITNVYRDYQVVLEDLPTNTNVGAIGPYSYPMKKFPASIEDNSYTYCWPKDWLGQDCNNLRIIGVNYETNLSMWAPVCPTETKKTLDDRSDELIAQLLKIGLGKRPIVWVTHSMGGLMVKNMLDKAYKSDKAAIRSLCLNTKGVVFYSTPHAGSSLAKLSQASALVIWPTIEVKELELDSPKLLEVHENFLKILQRLPIKIITFIETKPTIISALKFRFLIVEPQSGNPKVGDYYEIPLDHLGICKPACRRSFLYQKVLNLIETVVSESFMDIPSSP